MLAVAQCVVHSSIEQVQPALCFVKHRFDHSKGFLVGKKLTLLIFACQTLC